MITTIARLRTLILALALTGLAIIATPTHAHAVPASAAADPPTRVCTAFRQETLCVERSGWYVRASLYGNSTVAGGDALVVGVKQCSGERCEIIAVVHNVRTPWRAMIPGHTYFAFGSWTHLTPPPAYNAVNITTGRTWRPCPC